MSVYAGLERSDAGRPAFSILDLAPIPAGATPADALHRTLDLAQHAERRGTAGSGSPSITT